MKLLFAPVAALLALAATPLAAQTLTAPLAPGEIELKIEALGDIPADTATIPVQIVGRGATEALAKADLAKKEKAVRAGLAKLGIPVAKIVAVRDDEPQYATVTDAPYNCAADAAAVYSTAADAATAAARAGDSVGCDEKLEARTLMVTVEDLTKLPEIAELVEEGYYIRATGTFFHRDEQASHSAAVAEAIAKARVEADTYAAAMGMRVVRMVRVGNAKPKINWPDLMMLFGGFASGLDLPRGESNALYELRALAAAHFAGVTIDFVLAPK